MSGGVFRRTWWQPPRTPRWIAAAGTAAPAPPAAVDAGYLVDIDWAQPVTDAFRIGVSTIDGTAPITNLLSATFTAADDVTTDTMTVRITRGRDDRLDVVRAGQATIVLTDPTGTYNPENAASPLAGAVRPMRQARVRYQDGAGGTVGLYRGFVRSIEHDPDQAAQRTTVECADLLWVLEQQRPTIGQETAVTVDRALGLILDAVGWTDPTLRSLAASTTTIGTFSGDGGTTALELVRRLIEVDRGDFYIAADGVATYRTRYTRYLASSQGTLSDSFIDNRPSVDIERISNRARVVRDGGGTATAVDADSVATYGYRDAPDIQTAYLSSDEEAQRLAAFIVTSSRDGAAPATIRLFDQATVSHQTGRDLGDKVTVASARAQVGTVDYHVESIDHDITEGGSWHQTRWVLSKAQGSAVFVIGDTAIGDPNILVY